ncbi:ribosomal subunit interface protein [Candidatus Adlerbacteria bacterium RIFCSPHIGHO2_02_FULL_54_18]|uniref:Ribosomal subunit interface protein n=2 Tax=Candidatus Adleribacteriota TaxID=1752736 RepID=A0A1F4Y443_9BACT|nr:MAG: ribosomal subunit interface protein [Candidatus Adlerbacteria bacterium RIFCSPLOWO2_01_FULL_54_21b]OGC88536.1 MAG: ribosomal subunit interface protein [Candidatus Adlerbacteria bacterium RIFCSPHIGHO2_02_FULL_54_18]
MQNYNIKGTGVEVSDELRDYVERRLRNTEKFLQGDSAAHVDVELEYHAMRDGEKYRAEFTVRASGGLYRTESWGGSMHAAIDLAIAQLQNELSRDKKKRLHLVRRSAQRVKDYLRGLRNKI